MDVVGELREERDRLASGRGPAPGRAWCEAWTRAVDAAVTALAGPAVARHRLAVSATGGYGRRELCPGSDVDLLIVHEGLPESELETLVKEIVYPLWDAGLQVGYAVRTPAEAEAIARDDLEVATSTLDARRVTGDGLLLSGVTDQVVERLRRRPARFLEALTAADDERRRRAGDAAEALEPDLKRGAGGLRDVQSLRWAAAAVVGTVGLDPLVSARHIGAPDRARLARAYDRLLAERVALHLELGRARDVLTFEAQPGVADRLGHRDGSGDRDTAAHRLLSAHFLAARTVDHVHRRAWRLLLADADRGRWSLRRPSQEVVGDGFELVDGVLRLPPDRRVDDAAGTVALLAALAEHDAVLDRRTAARLRRSAEEGEVDTTWDGAARRRFLKVLWQGRAALPAIFELDDVGLIAALLPEWEPLRGRAQRNPFHRYSLDRHAWHAAAELGELVRHESWAATTLEAVDDRTGLVLGVLLHDVGKAFGEPHSETGVPVAAAIAERLGCRGATVELVRRLTRLHLLLPDTASRRDLADPAEIRRVAATVGDQQTLACLHLLAAADGVATGPAAWTPWKASLVQTLVTKVRAVLDEIDPDDVREAGATTAAEAQRIAPGLGVDAAAVRAHLALLPGRYGATVSPRAIVRHAGLAAAPLEPAEARTRVTPGEERDAAGLEAYDEIDIVARDRPGLFSKVAGVLALHGGDIVAASAFTRTDGLAVDTFVVRRPTEKTGSFWVSVEGDITEALAGRLALSARVGRKARHDRRRTDRLPEVATAVTVSQDASGGATVIEVHTQDRLGVLYAISAALAELELDIVVARIQTMGHEVVDVFYVRGADGRPLDDDHAEEAELAITAALAP